MQAETKSRKGGPGSVVSGFSQLNGGTTQS